MNRWTQLKNTVALLSIVITLTAAPFAVADAQAPPTGKYLQSSSNTLVWYDSVTRSVTPLIEPVSPYVCYRGAPFPGNPTGQCGNCGYVPDGQASWEAVASQYIAGKCANVNSEGSNAGEFGLGLYRVDVRVEETNSAPIYYWVRTSSMFCWSGCDRDSTTTVVAPTACSIQETLLGTWVHSCGTLPRVVDVRHLITNQIQCYEVIVGRDPAAFFGELYTSSCEEDNH